MLLFQLLFWVNGVGQVDNLNVGFTKYSAGYTLSKVRPDWYWYSLSVSNSFSKNSIEYGIKYNATYQLTDSPGNMYDPIPRDSKSINNFSLFADYKRLLPFSSEKVQWSVYSGVWLSRTQFYYTSVYYVDTNYYYQNKFTSRTNLLNFNLGLELKASIKEPLWFYLKSGFQATFIGDSEIGASDFRRFRVEFGLSYSFRSALSEKND